MYITFVRNPDTPCHSSDTHVSILVSGMCSKRYRISHGPEHKVQPKDKLSTSTGLSVTHSASSWDIN